MLVNKRISRLILAMLVAGSMAFSAETKLATATGTDLVAVKLSTDTNLIADIPASRESISLSWSLEKDAAPIEATPAHVAESHGYWQGVSAADLENGLVLPLTATGALVRISPSVAGTGIEPNDLVLVSAGGSVYERGAGARVLVTPDQQRAAGNSAIAPDTAVFQIAEGVGAGEVLLYADQRAISGAEYVLEVLERDSGLKATIQTPQDVYFWGQTVSVQVGLNDGGQVLQGSSMVGSIIDPNGRTYPLQFEIGQSSGRLQLPEQNGGMGLWQVQVRVEGHSGGRAFRRVVRTAFAVSQPTARLTGKIDLDGFRSSLGLEIAVAGRYEIRGLLYGTDARGRQLPLAVGNSAAWLEPGAANLGLDFDPMLVAESGLGAPFMVKDLRLLHQNRMSLLHRQAEAFTLNVK